MGEESGIISQAAASYHSWSWFVVGAVTLCSCVLMMSFNGENRKLKHIPTGASTIPIVSSLKTWLHILRVKELVDESLRKWPRTMFRIPEPTQWTVVAADGAVVAELLRTPESTFSGTQANDELVQMKYTIGAEITTNPYHFPLLRNQLRRSIPQLVPQVHEEVVDSFEKFIPLSEEWFPVKFATVIPKIICQASNRIFVGYPLCRDSGFMELSTSFTWDVFVVAFTLRCTPVFLRPFVYSIISNIPKRRRQALKYLGPLIDTRREERAAKGSESKEQPVDMITWLMDAAKDEETTNEALSKRLLAINFAAIQTTSTTFLHALYDLAAFPEFAHILREEVDIVVREHGWSKDGLDRMKRVDSFLKESQRMHPHANVGLVRLGLEDHTFCDGTFVPKGTLVAVGIHGPHFNDALYPDAYTFDPLRFVKLQETSERPVDLTSTSPDFLSFGHGRHACPGRYLAAAEMKLILAYIVMNYDVKFADEGKRPGDLWLMTLCLPKQDAEVLFRKRRDGA